MMTVAEVSVWRAVGVYTATEAAWLLMDQVPRTHWIDKTDGVAFALACRVRERFGTSDYGNWGTADMIRNAPPTRQRITLAELSMFAAEIGLTPIICNPDAAARESEPVKAKTGRPARVTDEAAAYARSEIEKGRPKNEVHCETITKFDLDVKPDAVRKRLAEQ